MKYFSLFSGIGGFEIALNENGGECVGFSEIDKYAIKIYNVHFPEHKNWGDITKIVPQLLPNFELLVGGFPCQAFSIAGKRQGFDDTRGTLFFDIARICKEKRPRYILLENVKGLLSHDSGRTFQTIIRVLTELGYTVQWQVLNSKDFGVPQNRERIFIVGHLRGESRPEVFPFTGTNTATLDYLGAILSESKKKWLDDRKTLSHNFPQASRVYTDKGLSATLAAQAGGLGAKTGLYAVTGGKNDGERKGKQTDVLSALTATHWKGAQATGRPLVAIPVLTPHRLEKRQQGRRFKEPGDSAFTLTAQDQHGVCLLPSTSLMAMRWQRTEKGKKVRQENQREGRDYTPFSKGHRELVPVPGKPVGALTAQAIAKDSLLGNSTQIRRLTPLECERLQGFPDGWTAGLSDTQRYKCLGNAVTVNVVREIVKKIFLNVI